MFFWFGVSDFITTGYALITYLVVFIILLLTVYIVDDVYQRKYVMESNDSTHIDLFK